MINDQKKTKEQLLQELKELRKRVAERETADTELEKLEPDLIRFKHLCDNAYDLVYICDDKGNVLYLNSVFEKLSGHKPEKFIGKPFTPVFKGEDLKKAENIYKKTLKGESPQEEIAFSKTGILCEYKNIPFKNSEGEIIGVIGTARDITERKKCEEILQGSYDELEEKVKKRTAELSKTVKSLQSEITRRKRVEEELKKSAHIIDAMGDILIVLNMQKKVIRLNTTALKLLGYTQEEVPSLTFKKLFPKRELKTHYANIERAIETGEARSFEALLLTKDGREVPTIISGTVMRNSEDKPIGLVGTFKDITENKRAELALQESEKKYRMLVENMNDGLGVIDEKGIMTYVNNRLCKMFGYSREEMIGSPVTFLLDDANQKLMEEQLARRKKGVNQSYELTFTRKDGGKVTTITSPEPIIDVNGRYMGSFAVMRDITNQKQVEDEKLIYYQNLKSLNQIAEVLQQTMGIDETLKKVLQKILSIFNCDRSWLLYPCDPDAPSYRIPYECTSPEHPGAFSLNEEQPITPFGQTVMNMVLANTDPVIFKFDKIDEVDSKEARDFVVKFNVQSQMLINLYPRVGKPWIMGLHQCSYPREWSKEEQRLFKDISIRMEDALTNKLLYQDLKRSEEKLRQSEEQYRTLIDNLQQKIFLKDKKSVYLSCNENYARDLMIKPDEIGGKTDFDFYPRKLAKKYRSDDRRIIRSDRPEELEEKYIQDGQEVFVQTVKTPVKDDEGNIFGVLGIFWDITERKRAEEKLKQSSQELEALTQNLRKMSGQLSIEDELSRRKFARILHEQVGQNLSAIKIQCSEVLKEHCTDKPKMEKVISHILSILDDTISSTRELTSELYPIILDRLGFIPAIGWYSDLILKPKKLKVKTDIDEFVESLPSEDKLSLFRIVQEAFHNIIKHASATEVDLKFKKVNRSIQLIIQDNGIGIDLEKIEKKKNKGIGLMLIKERVLSLGGDFKIECILKKGTRLLIEIPVK